jgi:uncharacterized DUF497 family protein
MYPVTRYSTHGVDFEWDTSKARTNLRKHRIHFKAACEAFFDPFFRVLDASGESGEIRQAILGMTSDWRLLYVVYVEREASLRIISARRTTSQERKLYEDQ